MSKIKTFKKFVCELTNNTLPQELVIVTEVDKVYFNNKDLLQVTKLFKYFNENNISKYNKWVKITVVFFFTLKLFCDISLIEKSFLSNFNESTFELDFITLFISVI